MRNTAIYLAAITLVSLCTPVCQAEIPWESKLRDAHSKAKKENKLMLLHFYSDNCVWCDRLEAGAFQSNSVMQSIGQNFVPVKIHGGKNPKLAKMFKVSKYPTDVIVTTDGKALSHSVSPQAPDRYIAMLGQARSNFADGKTLIAGNAPAKTPSPTPPAANTAPVNTVATQPATTTRQPQTGATAPSGLAMPNSVATAPATPPTADNSLPVQIPAPGFAVPPSQQNTLASAGSPRGNQFVLPSASTSGVQASLTGARTDGMSLSAAIPSATMEMAQQTLPPAPETTNSVATTAEKTTPASKKPEVAMQGYCPVSVINDNEWVEGNPDFGVIHLGKLYLFVSKQAMDAFLADPIPFTPMLNGIDVVRFFEEKKIVQGRREWGVVDQVHNRMFFFADEAAMNHFTQTFENYLDPAIEVMDAAVKAANPGA